MPATASIPDDLLDLFEEPAIGHVSYLNEEGQIVTWPMWIDYDGNRLMASSPMGSKKGTSLRARPDVAVSIVSTTNPFRWLSVSGRVVEIRPDTDLQWIDRMSRKYLGMDYERRSPREVFGIEIDRISTSGAWGS